jgi:hypothetical protein
VFPPPPKVDIPRLRDIPDLRRGDLILSGQGLWLLTRPSATFGFEDSWNCVAVTHSLSPEAELTNWEGAHGLLTPESPAQRVTIRKIEFNEPLQPQEKK